MFDDLPILHLSRAQSRAVDHIAIVRFQMPGIVLMENASRGSADIAWSSGQLANARGGGVSLPRVGKTGGGACLPSWTPRRPADAR